MKKKIFLFILIITSGFVYSQTIQETEDWINKNINDYPRKISGSMNLTYYLEVVNGFLYTIDTWTVTDSNYISQSLMRTSLKDIKHIEYSYDTGGDTKDSKFIYIEFKSYDNKVLWDKDFDKRNNEDDVVFEIYPSDNIRIQTSIDFEKSGMKERMSKAFLHLIKLYGGNAVIKKEPF